MFVVKRWRSANFALYSRTMKDKQTLILTLSCRDTVGIVAAVSGFLAEHEGFILESAQFGDLSTGKFFMRTKFIAGAKAPDRRSILERFAHVAKHFGMEWEVHNVEERPRVMILVSKAGHCLNAILHRYSTGRLPIEIPAVVSNHRDLEEMVRWHDIPFHYLPVTKGTKTKQEKEISALVDSLNIDVVVLARYMQILSDSLCQKLRGRAINIHHSFLPGFKGAKPYHQAHARGVKIIGATAHYVTHDLDEGPIIEQEVIRVHHGHAPEELVSLGQDIENVVLIRALKYHIEHRVLLNGNKTVIFT